MQTENNKTKLKYVIKISLFYCGFTGKTHVTCNRPAKQSQSLAADHGKGFVKCN